MSYTIADFVKDTEEESVFVEGLPKNISVQLAAEKLGRLNLSLEVNNTRQNKQTGRPLIFEGWFPKDFRDEQNNILFTLELKKKCCLTGYVLTVHESAYKYLE